MTRTTRTTRRTGTTRTTGTAGRTAAPTRTDAQQRMLGIYLNDHLAGLTGVVELARRAAGAEASSPLGPPLRTLAADLAEDRDALREMMGALGIGVVVVKLGAGWAAEKLGRLKLNGSWVHRSALAPVVELEGLALGIASTATVWRVLRGLAEEEPALDAARLDRRLERSAGQAEQVERLRCGSAAAAMGAPAGSA